MVYSDEDNFLMISGIQHFQFCKRQWALIHIEQQWEDNVRTIEGQYIHEKVNMPFLREKRGKTIIVRGMPVKSETLKITGICDVVEFVQDEKGITINNAIGKYLPCPIEYKRGKLKKSDADLLQLVAQAICLEEMLLCEVNKGYIFYYEIRDRVEVLITEELKNKVKDIVKEMYRYFSIQYTPKVKPGNFCKSCSLANTCLPVLMNKRGVKSYIEGKINE